MSKSGPSTSGSSTSNSTYSGTQTSQVPEWVNQASQGLYGGMANYLGGYNPFNEFTDASAQQAGQFGTMAAPAYNAAAGYFGNDRGGNIAMTAIDRLFGLRGGSDGGGSIYGGAGAGGGPGMGSGVRDTNWRDFTEYDVGAYMNPYTQNVIDAGNADIDQNMARNATLRAAEQIRQGAFGGSATGVGNALGQGEEARARGALNAQLRSQAYDNATNLIGRDQTGDFNSQVANQQGDLGILNNSTSRYNANLAAGSSQYSTDRNTELNALLGALNGGMNLGGMDIARGSAFQGLGESAYDRLNNQGLQISQLGQQPFNMAGQLGNMLAGLPFDRTSTSSGSSMTEGTERSRSTQNNTNAYLGLLLSMFGGG